MRIWGTLFYFLFSLGLVALCLAFFLGGFLVVQQAGAQHTRRLAGGLSGNGPGISRIALITWMVLSEARHEMAWRHF